MLKALVVHVSIEMQVKVDCKRKSVLLVAAFDSITKGSCFVANCYFSKA